ncbi:MAG: M16 family metallopeptidase [Anaerolineae bacterium]
MYELTTLDNGLRILTVSLPYVQSVSLGFFLGVGSRYESEEISGASHFIEHMLFKGTVRWPTARDIAEAIEGKGGVFNASTGLETSLFWAKVAAAHLPAALDVLSDMLLQANFDQVEMEKERAVITEEISYMFDSPESLAQILVNRLQWPDHPLGRDVTGTPETVANMKRESLLTFMADHYRPDATILGMAGRISHRDAVTLAKQYLGEWEATRAVPWEPAPPERDGPRIHLEARDTEQAHVAFSFAGPSRQDTDRHAVRLLNVILGEGMRSRLFQEIRERLGLAYTVDSYASTLQDTGTVSIYAGVAAHRAEETIKAVLKQLDQLRQESVPEDELHRTKEFMRGRLSLSLEDSFTLAAWYTRQQLFGPEVLEPADTLERLDAVQTSDLQRLARAIFREERLNLAVVGPFSQNGDHFREIIHF